jgi:cytochrome c oxidase subunit I
VISLVGALMFVYLLIKTVWWGEKAPANPWGEGATTLEWTVDSPAPFHTHEVPPRIAAQPAE